MFLFSPLISACHHFSFWNMGFYIQKGLFRLSSPPFPILQKRRLRQEVEAGTVRSVFSLFCQMISHSQLSVWALFSSEAHTALPTDRELTYSNYVPGAVWDEVIVKNPITFFPGWDTNFIFHPFHLWCLRILLNLYHKRWDHLYVLLQITYCVLRSLLLEHQLI